jgi:micrococcal nuclease
VAESTRTCPHCQASVRAELQFCSECGQELRPAARRARRPQAGTSRKRVALLLGGALAILCFSCAGLLVAISLFAPALLPPAEETAAERALVTPATGLSTSTLTPIAIPPPGTGTPVPAATVLPTGMTGSTGTAAPIATPSTVAERTEARVVDVIDGDTIDVQIDGQTHTLRYIGIDAPDTAAPGEPAEWLGPEASLVNERLVGEQTVYLEVDVSETDPDGRLLRYVFSPDGTFVNAELVRLGYARARDHPPDVKYQELLRQMEQEAREAGRGLWGPNPTPPSSTATAGTTATNPTPASTETPTPSATPAPTETPTGAPTSAPAPRIVIADVFNSGTSEYVEIANEGNAEQNMSLWSVRGSSGSQRYVFPGGYVLGPGARVRLHSGDGGIDAPPGDIYWTTEEVWDNQGETVYLADIQGRQVDEYSY